MLRDLRAYSEWIYRLAERNPEVTGSTLRLVPIGATLAKLEGAIELSSGVEIEVWELIDFAEQRIRNYSYEVYRGGKKISWYDPWPHPEVPELASTFPRHKHTPPNIRENRQPAPGFSFESPNLEIVVRDSLQHEPPIP
jgi:hypothetical protein